MVAAAEGTSLFLLCLQRSSQHRSWKQRDTVRCCLQVAQPLTVVLDVCLALEHGGCEHPKSRAPGRGRCFILQFILPFCLCITGLLETRLHL